MKVTKLVMRLRDLFGVEKIERKSEDEMNLSMKKNRNNFKIVGSYCDISNSFILICISFFPCLLYFSSTKYF